MGGKNSVTEANTCRLQGTALVRSWKREQMKEMAESGSSVYAEIALETLKELGVR